MVQFKRKHLYFGIPLIGLVAIAGIWWYNYLTEPVATGGGTELSFRGVRYVMDWTMQPTQKWFHHQIGRTEDGESVCAIDGEDPKDYIFVLGDMMQSTYRRATLPAPKFSPDNISKVIFTGTTPTQTPFQIVIRDPKLIADVSHMINLSPTIATITATPAVQSYDINLFLSNRPGLEASFTVIKAGTHFYFQVDSTRDTRVEFDNSPFARWIQNHETGKSS